MWSCGNLILIIIFRYINYHLKKAIIIIFKAGYSGKGLIYYKKRTKLLVPMRSIFKKEKNQSLYAICEVTNKISRLLVTSMTLLTEKLIKLWYKQRAGRNLADNIVSSWNARRKAENKKSVEIIYKPRWRDAVNWQSVCARLAGQ